MEKENLLMVADSEHDADMLYAVKMFVPDSFIFLRSGGKTQVVMSDLEIDRARKQAPHCKIISLTNCQKKLRKLGKPTNTAHVIELLLAGNRAKKVVVPRHFPIGLARELEKLKIKIAVRDGAFFPERETKSADEVKKLTAALRMAEAGMAAGIRALKSSVISKDKKLLLKGAPLTSEKLRAIIDIAVTEAGGLASHTIVAGGKQGCDPHERGHGILRANESIILDIFPRSQTTGYFGDITRTVVKGKASEALKKLYHTVERGQEIAFKKIRNGVAGAEIHKAIQEMFEREGYKTGLRDGRMQGFFHGTGHGLGLEIHEAPRVSISSDAILKSGNVVTVEPGLYYPSIGGVRLEDVAVVTATGMRNLTKFEKVLEL
jgi:Xaa-Pro aminopeptidase